MSPDDNAALEAPVRFSASQQVNTLRKNSVIGHQIR
jgi:hypothetical protein